MQYLPLAEIIVERLTNSFKVVLKFVGYSEVKKFRVSRRQKLLDFCKKSQKFCTQHILITYLIDNQKHFFESYYLFEAFFLNH